MDSLRSLAPVPALGAIACSLSVVLATPARLPAALSLEVVPNPDRLVFPNGGSAETMQLSGDGSTVVGTCEFPFGVHGFRATLAQGIVPVPAGASSSLADVSFDGQAAVGTFGDGVNDVAFHWSATTGVSPLPIPGSAVAGWAAGVSDDGGAAAGTLRFPTYGELYACLWEGPGGVTLRHGLGDPSIYGLGATSAAAGISGDGEAVFGTSATDDDGELAVAAVRWAGETPLRLPALPGASSAYPYASNPDGSVIVGSNVVDSVDRAFRWTSAGDLVDLGSLEAGDTVALGVSADGAIITGYSYRPSTGYPHAFVWDAAHGVRDLHTVLSESGLPVEGLRLISAFGVSHDGRTLAVYGEDPSGAGQIWLVRNYQADTPEDAYAVWAAAHGLVAANEACAADPDGDDIANGLEWILGGHPLAGDRRPAPRFASDSTHLVGTFNRCDASEASCVLHVCTTTDFVTWRSHEVPAASAGPDADGVAFSVAENGDLPDEVTVSLPFERTPGSRLFVGLRAAARAP